MLVGSGYKLWPQIFIINMYIYFINIILLLFKCYNYDTTR